MGMGFLRRARHAAAMRKNGMFGLCMLVVHYCDFI